MRRCRAVSVACMQTLLCVDSPSALLIVCGGCGVNCFWARAAFVCTAPARTGAARCAAKKSCCCLAMLNSGVGTSGGVYYRDTPQRTSAAQRERVALRQDDLPVLVGDVPAHQPVGDHVRTHALLRRWTVSAVCSCSCVCGLGMGVHRPKLLWRPLCVVLWCLACVGYRFEGVDDGARGGVHAVLEQREVELCPLPADVPELLEQVAAAHDSQAARAQ